MRLGEWWRKLEHPAWAGGGVILATLVGIVSIALTRSSGDEEGGVFRPASAVPTAATSPRNVLEQIEQSDVWLEPPTVFESADGSESGEAGVPWNVAAVQLGDVIALTPEELVDDGLRYEGAPIYIVGRVSNRRSVPTGFGLEEELELLGRDGTVAYVGSAGSLFGAEGDLIFALGRLAALGRAQVGDGRAARAAYFLAMEPDGGGNYDIGLVRGLGLDLSPAIRDAARRATRGALAR
ncbi:MAG: hypothetical protein M3198_14535 [Actinomycetota bacterium]|nr:hypothetical protein [Actinomycetota bacterium]